MIVSHGQGFSRLNQPSQLAVGDRVAVSQGNRAKIAYPDGCEVDVLPGAVQIIAETSPCTQSSTQSGADALGAAAIGAGALGAGLALGLSGGGAAPFTQPRSP
jgi:hypothetical protein